MNADKEARRQHRLAVDSGVQHVINLLASDEVDSAVGMAVAMVRNTRPALRRCREESGYSLGQIIERCDTLKEASLQSGIGYLTVIRYADRWGMK